VPDREAGRLVRRAVPPAQRAAPCLMPDELMAVARLAKAAERYYRTPQDIEWATDAQSAESYDPVTAAPQ
jgi:pyruvate, water dikinase